MGESDTPQYLKYTSVAGFFQQDDPATEPNGFDYVSFAGIHEKQMLMVSDNDEFWLDLASI